MATVTGITEEKAAQIDGHKIISGAVSNGTMILTKQNNETVNVGSIADTAHQDDFTTHGATGAVVGTTNTQTLTNKTLTTPTIASFVNAQHDHTTTTDGGAVSVDAALTSSDTVLTGRSLGAGDVNNELSLAVTNTLAAGKYLIIGSCLGFTLGSGAATRLKWGLSTSAGTLYASPITTQSETTGVQGGASIMGYLENASDAVVTMYVMKLNDSGVLADTSTNGFLVAIRLSDMT